MEKQLLRFHGVCHVCPRSYVAAHNPTRHGGHHGPGIPR